jgi:hypothetical protein
VAGHGLSKSCHARLYFVALSFLMTGSFHLIQIIIMSYAIVMIVGAFLAYEALREDIFNGGVDATSHSNTKDNRFFTAPGAVFSQHIDVGTSSR